VQCSAGDLQNAAGNLSTKNQIK